MFSWRYLLGLGALAVAIIGLVVTWPSAKPGTGAKHPERPAEIPVAAKPRPESVITWTKPYRIDNDGTTSDSSERAATDTTTPTIYTAPTTTASDGGARYSGDDPAMSEDERRQRELIRWAAEKEVKRYLAANSISDPCLLEQPESAGKPGIFYVTGIVGMKTLLITVSLNAQGKPEWAAVTQK